MPPGSPHPDRRQDTVAVSRGLLVALAAALGAALLAVAFLLGRQTASTSPAATAPAASASDHPAAATPVEVEAPVGTGAQAADADAAADPQAAAAPPAANAAPVQVRVMPAIPGVTVFDPGTRAEVMRYFSELDRIEATAKTWSDPQQLANDLLQQTVAGNSGGFDSLLATQRQARERLRAMAVPAACREHHAQVEALMDEAIALLGSVREAATSGNLDGLQNVAEAARALEAKSKRLEAQAASLKQRYAG